MFKIIIVLILSINIYSQDYIWSTQTSDIGQFNLPVTNSGSFGMRSPTSFFATMWPGGRYASINSQGILVFSGAV